MSATETTVPTALDRERALMAQIQHAGESATRAGQRAAEARRRIDAQERVRHEAVKAGVRGEDNAGGRLKGADKALATAQREYASAAEEGHAAKEVERDARAQLDRLRVELFEELAESAKALTARAEATGAEAEQALTAYLAAWEVASGRWRQLSAGVRSRVEAADAALGQIRDEGVVRRESAPPECPVDPTTISRVRNIPPRPWAMDERYVPGQPPPTFTVAPPTEPVFFDSDRPRPTVEPPSETVIFDRY